ncbi:MAG: DinB family protein [Chloroflexi bacterium]|nr:DinB family protein [Chloroflexota bacterium]MCC6892384.1 DinB family protein [Anaerolineae bacterium]
MSRKTELKAKLEQSRQHLNHVLDLVGDRWDTQVYTEGAAWTVRQLAVHLMISDKGQTSTVMGIARGEDPIPADFDLERYNRRSVEKRADTPLGDIRASLAASYAEREAWLNTLDEAALDNRGRHGSGQILSVAEILRVMADHEEAHANDIARLLKID